METISLGKKQYFSTLVDNKTGYIWFHPCSAKYDFSLWFISMDRLFFNQYKTHVKVLRSDQGGEYVNMVLESYCTANGIKIELTVIA